MYNNDVEKVNGEMEYRDLSNYGNKWTKYQGDFRSDIKEGFGTLYFSNGEKYVGGFKADHIHGAGAI